MVKTLEINGTIYYTYADLDDANIYNNAIYGSTWSSLDEIAQKQLLIQGTRKIDSYNYVGEKLDKDQALKFPRIMLNGTVSDDNLLTQLCCQVAAYYYTSGTSSSSGDSSNLLNNIENYQIADLHVKFKSDAKIDLSSLDDIIEKALKNWMISNSMEIWL